MEGQTHERKDGRMDGQAQSNMPLQLFQSWGHQNIDLALSGKQYIQLVSIIVYIYVCAALLV